MATTIVSAVLAAGAIALALVVGSEPTASTAFAALGAIVCTAAAVIVGSVACGRWHAWLAHRSDRAWPVMVLGWSIPLAVGVVAALLLVGLGPPASSSVLVGILVAASPCLVVAAVVLLVVGIVRHVDAARRRGGWLPRREIAERDERQRWQSAWSGARSAFEHLEQRRMLPTVDVVDVMMRPGERCFLHTDVEYARFTATDAVYQHSSSLYLGSPLFVAAGMVGSAIGNAHARRTAEAHAAHQWRERQASRLLLTDQRLLIHTVGGWLTFDHQVVASFHPEAGRWFLVVEYQGTSALRLSGLAAPHIAVVMAAILSGPESLRRHPSLAALAPTDEPVG